MIFLAGSNCKKSLDLWSYQTLGGYFGPLFLFFEKIKVRHLKYHFPKILKRTGDIEKKKDLLIKVNQLPRCHNLHKLFTPQRLFVQTSKRHHLGDPISTR